jgi:hypothetical protein
MLVILSLTGVAVALYGLRDLLLGYRAGDWRKRRQWKIASLVSWSCIGLAYWGDWFQHLK